MDGFVSHFTEFCGGERPVRRCRAARSTWRRRLTCPSRGGRSERAGPTNGQQRSHARPLERPPNTAGRSYSVQRSNAFMLRIICICEQMRLRRRQNPRRQVHQGRLPRHASPLLAAQANLDVLPFPAGAHFGAASVTAAGTLKTRSTGIHSLLLDNWLVEVCICSRGMQMWPKGDSVCGSGESGRSRASSPHLRLCQPRSPRRTGRGWVAGRG